MLAIKCLRNDMESLKDQLAANEQLLQRRRKKPLLQFEHFQEKLYLNVDHEEEDTQSCIAQEVMPRVLSN